LSKTNLSNHLFLLAATTSVVALLVGFAPPEIDRSRVDLQVPLQIASKDNIHPVTIKNQLPTQTVMPYRLEDDADYTVENNQNNADDNSAFNVTTIRNLSLKKSSIEFGKTMLLNDQQPDYEIHSKTISAGDSIYKIFSAHGVSNSDIYEISLSDTRPRELTLMQPGQTLTYELRKDADSVLVNKLILQKSLLEQVVFTAVEGDFTKETIVRTPETIQVYKEVIIKHSLSFDGLKAGINQSILSQLANIFGWDIDFALDLREGDTFSLLYEERQLDGEHIGFGNILAAQFVNNGKTFQAIRYETSVGAHYYTPDGLSMRKAFIRNPVDFSRISSSFNPNRLHPVFKTSRPHRGVDYAANTGTPIKSSGDGKVIFKGTQNGYGNVIIVNHGRGYTTLYAHMNGFVRSIKRGSKVKQGQVIGFVGKSGYATGPHLHYEFRINGTHQNPVTVKLPNDLPMSKQDLQRYLPYSQKMTASLHSYHSPEYTQKLAKLTKKISSSN